MEKIRLGESLKLIILISGDLGKLGEVTLNVGLKEPFCFTDEMKIRPIWDSEAQQYRRTATQCLRHRTRPNQRSLSLRL